MHGFFLVFFVFLFNDVRKKSCRIFLQLVTKNKLSVSISELLILSRTACQKTGALMCALLQTTDGGYSIGLFKILLNSRMKFLKLANWL